MAQFNTRIQLKSDTTEHWNAIQTTFQPLMGEMIIYLPSSDHPDTRIKIGDGNTFLKDLNFIDAGTINGNEVEVVTLTNYNARPQIGSPDKLYIDAESNKLYYYNSQSGYHQLSNFSLNLSFANINTKTDWFAGRAATAVIDDNTLQITTGILPMLTTVTIPVVTNVTQE